MYGKMFRAIGLMSGTSLDGIDAAIINSDGKVINSIGSSLTYPYDPKLRQKVRNLFGMPLESNAVTRSVSNELTLEHARAVRGLLELAGGKIENIDVIGFHGQTVFHAPEKSMTCQIGNGKLLARELGVTVAADFRTNDIAHGGQGAPLVPLFHKALAEPLEKPISILNIGGVANLTWISADDGILAFDTGPGNALIDDWVAEKAGNGMDEGGALARSGMVDKEILRAMLTNPYFERPYPKSLDRNYFTLDPVRSLSSEDGAATLTAFTAACVAKAENILPSRPIRWLASGGGRHNLTLMSELRACLKDEVVPIEIAGWQGDSLEAQAFGFLAVRSLLGLPISLPSTTGCSHPVSGGTLYYP